MHRKTCPHPPLMEAVLDLLSKLLLSALIALESSRDSLDNHWIKLLWLLNLRSYNLIRICARAGLSPYSGGCDYDFLVHVPLASCVCIGRLCLHVRTRFSLKKRTEEETNLLCGTMQHDQRMEHAAHISGHCRDCMESSESQNLDGCCGYRVLLAVNHLDVALLLETSCLGR